MTKKVYVAGPISNTKDFMEKFAAAERRLRADGNIVLNPSVIPGGLEQHEYMSICIPALYACDEIYMLENWENSVGATIERDLAIQKGMPVRYQTKEAVIVQPNLEVNDKVAFFSREGVREGYIANIHPRNNGEYSDYKIICGDLTFVIKSSTNLACNENIMADLILDGWDRFLVEKSFDMELEYTTKFGAGDKIELDGVIGIVHFSQYINDEQMAMVSFEDETPQVLLGENLQKATKITTQ